MTIQDCQYWLAYLGMQCRLHELRHKRRISVAAASKILANLVYSYKGMGLSMGTMCAGVTPSEGPALYYIDSDGTRLAGNLFCVGSGQTFAYGVLDAEYSYDMEDDVALELGRRSILAATHRDAFSGGFINLYHVKEDGWVKHGFSDTNPVSAGCRRIWWSGILTTGILDLLEDQAGKGRVLQRHCRSGLDGGSGRWLDEKVWPKMRRHCTLTKRVIVASADIASIGVKVSGMNQCFTYCISQLLIPSSMAHVGIHRGVKHGSSLISQKTVPEFQASTPRGVTEPHSHWVLSALYFSLFVLPLCLVREYWNG